MSNKFTILRATEEDKIKETKHIDRTILFHEAWKRQYHKSVSQTVERNKDMEIDDYPQDDLMKLALCGIKYIRFGGDVEIENDGGGIGHGLSLEEQQAKFQLIDTIFVICGHLTIRNFVTTFPIDKDYDGEKWGCKDYFYTMDVLSRMDWDKPIGRENFFEFLWDYENDDLRNVCTDYMCVISALYRAQTGKGIAEQFFEERGIETYKIDKENGIIKNNQTGEVGNLSKSRHIRIVR